MELTEEQQRSRDAEIQHQMRIANKKRREAALRGDPAARTRVMENWAPYIKKQHEARAERFSAPIND